MQHSRRRFIKHSGLALAAASILPGHLFAETAARETLGLQLYSVRDDMKKDPAGTLKKLAVMGYQHVEHANYIDHKFYGYTQPEFKKLLNDLGLKMPSGHTRMNAEHWDAAKKRFYRRLEKNGSRCCRHGPAICYQPLAGRQPPQEL